MALAAAFLALGLSAPARAQAGAVPRIVAPGDAAARHATRTWRPPAGARLALAGSPAEVTAGAPLRADADLAMWSPAHGGHGTQSAFGGSERSGDPIHRFARGIVSRTSSLARSLTRNAMRFIGTPYVFGGTSRAGFDCSGYVQHVFAMLGIPIPRTADAQYYAARRPIGGIAKGDLVFFQTYAPGPSHVGIYLGSGKFIHSCSHGVMISKLRERYWAARYLGAKRVVAQL